jgi:hypothetical protein
MDMLDEYVDGFIDTGIIDPNPNHPNDVRLVGTIALIAVLILAVVGMDWVARVRRCT